jgi:hypothetical protein
VDASIVQGCVAAVQSGLARAGGVVTVLRRRFAARSEREVEMRTNTDVEALRYPIGRCQPRSQLSAADLRLLIDDLAALPGDLREAVAPLSDERLDTPYRPQGWTVRQVAHHLPDSHMNGLIRCKLALTEEAPTIKPYDEAAWAELPDGCGPDVEGSLLLLAAVHRRWASLLRSLDGTDLARTYLHPVSGPVTVERTLQLYAWHGRHHLAHITQLGARSGW